jgi:hypothetical protein
MAITVTLASCCTDVECTFKHYPSLSVELVDFNASGNGVVKVFDSTSVLAINSFGYQYNNFHIDYIESEKDIRTLTYIVQSEGGRSDTISKINFEVFDFVNNCNTCFLMKQREIATNYRNLEYYLNGKKYQNTADIKIHK